MLLSERVFELKSWTWRDGRQLTVHGKEIDTLWKMLEKDGQCRIRYSKHVWISLIIINVEQQRRSKIFSQTDPRIESLEQIQIINFNVSQTSIRVRA